MANDCLVTKLKGVVQNDNLPYLNTVCFDFIAKTGDSDIDDAVLMVVVSSNKTCKIFSVGGTFTVGDQSTPVNEYVASQGSYSTIKAYSDGAFKLYIEKDAIKGFGAEGSTNKTKRYNLDISQLDYADALEIINLKRTEVHGEFKPELNQNIRQLHLTNSNFNINLENIQYTSNFEAFTVTDCNYIIGNINNLYKNINLTNIDVRACPNIIGQLEEFCRLMATQKDSTITHLTFLGDRTGITYQGALIPVNTAYDITFDQSLPNGYSITVQS